MQQPIQTGVQIAAVDDLKEHFLIGDGVHQPVGAQQDKVPLLHRADIPVAGSVGIPAQSAGDEVPPRMAAGLISGDVAVVHHGLHQRVILGDAGDPRLRDVIGPAVAHVGDHHAVLIGHSGNQSGTHIGKRRLRLCPLCHGPVGHGHRVGRSLPELLRGHIRFQGLLHLRRVSLRRQRTGKPAAGGTAHTVAHHTDVTVPGDPVSILIFLSHKASIRNGPGFYHDSAAPFFRSSISFRRSWPQEASISPPRLRRTVAVKP